MRVSNAKEQLEIYHDRLTHSQTTQQKQKRGSQAASRSYIFTPSSQSPTPGCRALFESTKSRCKMMVWAGRVGTRQDELTLRLLGVAGRVSH